MEPHDLHRRARRSYEFGRLRHAIAIAWPVPALAAASAPASMDLGLHALICAALLVLATALPFRGGSGGRAVGPGLAAGLFPLIVPVLAVRLLWVCFGPGCWTWACMMGCVAGGAGAGVWLGLRAARLDADRVEWLVAGMLVASLTGALGCAFAGLVGLAVMVVAMVVVSGPVAAIARAPAT